MEQSSLGTFDGGDGVGSDSEEVSVLKVNYTVESGDDGPRPVVHVFGRTPDGDLRHVRVTGVRPYFYAPTAEVEGEGVEDERITGTGKGYESIEGDDLTRLYTRIPADVGEVRDSFTHYEADILFPDRFRIDNNVKSGMLVETDDEEIEIDAEDVAPCDADAPARTCVLDIEVEDRNGFPENGEEPVVCLTAWDSFDEEYHVFVWNVDEDDVTDDGYVLHAYDDEEGMQDGFLGYLDDRDPDVLTGWNSNDFDLPYLIDRLGELDGDGMEPNRLARVGDVWHDDWGGPTVKGRATFDLLYGYQRMNFTELESYRLDAIAEEELGESKVTYTGKIGDLWEDDPDRLLEYNKMDVELCVRIDEKVGIVDFFRELARFVGCSLEDATTPSDVVDIYVLRKAYGNFVLPSKRGGGGGEEYEGGEVFEPITGIRENVGVLDLASLYPMSMVTVNASPETKVGDDYDGETYDVGMPDGSEVCFRKEPEGLTKSIVTELLEERDKKKSARDEHEMGTAEYEKYDDQQNAIKVVMNSYYGVAGYPRFRLYDREMGSAVTATGRAVIEHTRDIVEEEGYEVVYGDTDSTLVELGDGSVDALVKRGETLEETVNESYDDFALERFNAETHRWEIEFEKLYRRFFQAGRKKRYAGKLVWKDGKELDEPDLDITGFEYKRSDVSGVTKEVQQEVIERILDGAGFDEVSEYVRDVVDRFKDGEFGYDEVGVPGGIGQKLDSYDTDTAQVTGAKYANEHLGTNFTSGSKPKRLYVKRVKGDYPPTDVVCFEYPEQIPDEFEIDRDKMLEKTVRNPIERILEALGWSWSEVVNGQRQQGLGSFT
ncbi:MAG: DNA-directed DNA polymerase [Halobacteriales archaeon]